MEAMEVAMEVAINECTVGVSNDEGGNILNVLLVFLMMEVAVHLMYCRCF